MRTVSLRTQRSVDKGSILGSGPLEEDIHRYPAHTAGVPTQALHRGPLRPPRLHHSASASVQGGLCKKSGGDLGGKGGRWEALRLSKHSTSVNTGC